MIRLDFRNLFATDAPQPADRAGTAERIQGLADLRAQAIDRIDSRMEEKFGSRFSLDRAREQILAARDLHAQPMDLSRAGGQPTSLLDQLRQAAGLRDVGLLPFIVEVCTCRDGFPGCADALELASTLTRAWWDTGSPVLGPDATLDDVDDRLRAYEWFGDDRPLRGLPGLLRQVPLGLGIRDARADGPARIALSHSEIRRYRGQSDPELAEQIDTATAAEFAVWTDAERDRLRDSLRRLAAASTELQTFIAGAIEPVIVTAMSGAADAAVEEVLEERRDRVGFSALRAVLEWLDEFAHRAVPTSQAPAPEDPVDDLAAADTVASEPARAAPSVLETAGDGHGLRTLQHLARQMAGARSTRDRFLAQLSLMEELAGRGLGGVAVPILGEVCSLFEQVEFLRRWEGDERLEALVGIAERMLQGELAPGDAKHVSELRDRLRDWSSPVDADSGTPDEGESDDAM